MSTTIFEETGGTYIPCGDYLLPNLVLPPEESTHSDIGAGAESIWLTSDSTSRFSTPIF